MSKFEVDESLAKTLVSHKWVSSTSTEAKTPYRKDEDGRVVTSKPEVRVIIHVARNVATRDDYNNRCLEILSDPVFEGVDIKFDRAFHDSCIYLTYFDEARNRLDIILGHPYAWSNKDKLAKLYSDIAGCDMKVERERMSVETWSCGMKQ